MYKAVGIVDYEKDKYTGRVRPKLNPLNKSKFPLQRCKCCGFSTIKDEGSPNCPICGYEMEQVKICSPLGFCVDYGMEPKDFNGNYEWYSPNSDIKLDCEKYLVDCQKVANMTIRNNIMPSQGRVHLVNDNNGNLYRLGINSNGIYVSRDAYDEESANKIQLTYESKYAFMSSKLLVS